MTADLIGLVEAAYDTAAPAPAWQRTIAERGMAVVDDARCGSCYAFDASNPGAPTFTDPVAVNAPPSFERQLGPLLREADLATLDSLHLGMRARKVATMTELLADRFAVSRALHDFLATNGFAESFGCVAADAEGHGVVFCAMLPRPTRLSRITRARWQRVAVHVAAAHRVRRRLGQPVADAVMQPGGRVVHAEGEAVGSVARDRLREACLARERARTRRTRADADEALGLWQALVAGRWSLVDRFESDGRRYVVARRNEPAAVGPLALTPRERRVVAHLVQGDSGKNRRVRPRSGSVGGVGGRAVRPPQAARPQRRGAVAGPPDGERSMRRPPSSVRAFRLDHEGDELLVLSVPLERDVPALLSAAEREVARAIVRGASNAEIARGAQDVRPHGGEPGRVDPAQAAGRLARAGGRFAGARGPHGSARFDEEMTMASARRGQDTA